jgi:hypothetical protein
LTLKWRVCTRMIVPLTRPASEFQLTRSWILKLFGTSFDPMPPNNAKGVQFSR